MPSEADYGRRVLAELRRKGLPTSQWNYATLAAMEKSSRLEFLTLFRKHDPYSSYTIVELMRTAEPEALVERLAAEKQARDQMMALIPIMFMGGVF